MDISENIEQIKNAIRHERIANNLSQKEFS